MFVIFYCAMFLLKCFSCG